MNLLFTTPSVGFFKFNYNQRLKQLSAFFCFFCFCSQLFLCKSLHWCWVSPICLLRMIQMMSLPLRSEHTAAVTRWSSSTSLVKRERRLQARRYTLRYRILHSPMTLVKALFTSTWGPFFGGRILSNFLFLISSGQWNGWQWTGFLQWWGRVE